MIYLIIFYLIGFGIVYWFDRMCHPARKATDLIARLFFSFCSWFTITCFILFLIPNQIRLLSKKEVPKWMRNL